MSDHTLTIDGFVILSPLAPWDQKKGDLIHKQQAPGTFGETPELAWRKFIGQKGNLLDVSTKIQRYHDRGWRLNPARITIKLVPSDDPLP